MREARISIICALSENRAIGKDNGLLCHIPEDLKRFKTLTMGHPIIMGRRTYESIGKALPGRKNIIITRNNDFLAKDCTIADSLEKALDIAKKSDKGEVFIIGGGQIYTKAIKFADKLYLTLLKKDFEADTFFPDYSEFKKVIFKEKGKSGDLEYEFIDLERQ